MPAPVRALLPSDVTSIARRRGVVVVGPLVEVVVGLIVVRRHRVVRVVVGHVVLPGAVVVAPDVAVAVVDLGEKELLQRLEFESHPT